MFWNQKVPSGIFPVEQILYYFFIQMIMKSYRLTKNWFLKILFGYLWRLLSWVFQQPPLYYANLFKQYCLLVSFVLFLVSLLNLFYFLINQRLLIALKTFFFLPLNNAYQHYYQPESIIVIPHFPYFTRNQMFHKLMYFEVFVLCKLSVLKKSL